MTSQSAHVYPRDGYRGTMVCQPLSYPCGVQECTPLQDLSYAHLSSRDDLLLHSGDQMGLLHNLAVKAEGINDPKAPLLKVAQPTAAVKDESCLILVSGSVSRQTP